MIEGGSKANDDCGLLWRYTEGVGRCKALEDQS